MRAFVLSVLALATVAPVFAQDVPKYSEVRLRLERTDETARITALGVWPDEHARIERGPAGVSITMVVNEWERARLEAGGVPMDVLVDDLAAAFLARPRLSASEQRAIESAALIRGFDFGTMAGFYRIDEMLAELDSMALVYPHLATSRISLGTSGEGRDIWMVKISDNPGVDEPEPEVLYTALHHAREPQSMMTVIYFMYYLLERYGTDPEVTALVNDREFYFIPMVNPDGYVFNETTNPDGGGMWRKTRRNNGDGTVGVDPNRNYGFNWGYDDEGSSPEGFSEIYRGPSAWSEPEIAAVRDFAEAREIRGAIHFHSAGELYLYPWGYEMGVYTPDNAQFFATSAQMASMNGYTYGASPDVLYKTNGGANDWFYGEQDTKPSAFSWTAEVATSFWPDMSDIFPVAQENVHAALVVAHLAGTIVADEPGPPAAGNVSITPNPSADHIRVEFQPVPVPSSIRITDILGRSVLEALVPSGSVEAVIDVRPLSPGPYYLAIIDDSGRRLTARFTRTQ